MRSEFLYQQSDACHAALRAIEVNCEQDSQDSHRQGQKSQQHEGNQDFGSTAIVQDR